MEILKTLKGGSLSKTEIVFDGKKKLVRKSISRIDNREYGLVRWQSQIRKLQILNKHIPNSSVIIERMGVFDNFYYYEIPFYEKSINCAEALIKGESADLIAQQISILLSEMASIDYGTTCGSLSVFVAEEISSPLQIALKAAKQNLLPLNSKDLDFFIEEISSAIILTDRLISQMSNIKTDETLTHGNLTLENILWDPESQKILMIDPYSETYCENIMGDVSQLLQSADSGYEYVSELYSKQVINIRDYPLSEIPNSFFEFSRKLKERISIETWYSDEYLMIFRASQFIRMFPFKMVIAPLQGISFMLHGLDLLEKT